MSGQSIDTNAFYDQEVLSLGVLTVNGQLVVQTRDGNQYDIYEAIKEGFAATSVTTAVFNDHIVTEVPQDVNGFWPIYTTAAAAEAASNTGVALDKTTAINGSGTGTYFMPELTNASSGLGVDYFDDTVPHVDESAVFSDFVVNGSEDSTVQIALSAGGISLYEEDGSGWYSEFPTDTSGFQTSGVTDVSGGLHGVVSIGSELYIKLSNTEVTNLGLSGNQYLNVIPSLIALIGITSAEAYISTGTERKSLHKFSYTVDFDVEIPINIEQEDYVADFELTNQSVNAMCFYHKNLGIDVSDDLSGNRVQSVNGTAPYFSAPVGNEFTISPISPRAKEYADSWLDLSGHNFHTLNKGLFGQMLVNAGTVPVELTLDTSGNSGENFTGYITDDSLERSVVPKKVGWVVNTENDVSGYSFFQDEHNRMMDSLTTSFRDIWGGVNKDENIDWYAALYRRTQTGDLFTDGDVFSVPIEVTMKYTISSDSGNPDYLNNLAGSHTHTNADDGTLTPLAVSITNVVTTDNQVVQEKWRFIYNFAVKDGDSSGGGSY